MAPMPYYSGPLKVRFSHRVERIYWPFVRCCRSKKNLFLRKAYIVFKLVDYDSVAKIETLSESEFMLGMLKGDFDEYEI